MKVIKLDDQTGELGLLIPDEIAAELGLKEGDEVELTAGPNRTIVINWPGSEQGSGDALGRDDTNNPVA